MFPVDILCRPSTDGPVAARSFLDIYNQLVQVMDQPRAAKQSDLPVICSLSALERKSWAAYRGKIQEQGGEVLTSLELMESAILALCLEDCDAPSALADVLNAVRLSGGGDNPCLRYYDKVYKINNKTLNYVSRSLFGQSYN